MEKIENVSYGAIQRTLCSTSNILESYVMQKRFLVGFLSVKEEV